MPHFRVIYSKINDLDVYLDHIEARSSYEDIEKCRKNNKLKHLGGAYAIEINENNAKKRLDSLIYGDSPLGQNYLELDHLQFTLKSI